MQYLVTQTSGGGGRNYPVQQHTSEPSYKHSRHTEHEVEMEVQTPALGGTDILENSGCMSWTKDGLVVGADFKDPNDLNVDYQGTKLANDDPMIVSSNTNS